MINFALRIENSRYVKVWKKEEADYGTKFVLGTSRKDQDGNYVNSNWWNCKLVGNAKEFGDILEKGDIIKINAGQIESVYKKDTGKTYFNLIIFAAEYEEGHEKDGSFVEKVKEMFEDDSELPF